MFWSDNMSVVLAVNSQKAKCPRVLHLLKKLVRVCLRRNVYFTAKHVPGVDNTVADALSHFKLAEFRARWPQADDRMTVFPESRWKLGAPLLLT